MVDYPQRLIDSGILDIIPLQSYVNMKTKILHQCSRGHQWSVKPSHVLHSKSKCPECRGIKRKTTDQHLEEIKPLSFEGEYKNAHSKLKYSCELGHTWSATPHSILSSRKSSSKGCPKCAGVEKITEEDYFERLPDSVILIDSYKGYNVHTLHQCLKCYREWKATPSNILRNYLCPACGGTEKKTNQVYQDELSLLGIRALDTYRNNKTPLMHQCVSKGHSIYTRPSTMLYSMQGCPYCREQDCTYYLYYLRFEKGLEQQFKIGITRNIPKRIKSLRIAPEWSVQIIYQKQYDSYGDVRCLEQQILAAFKDKRMISKIVRNGNTEFFSEDIFRQGLPEWL